MSKTYTGVMRQSPNPESSGLKAYELKCFDKTTRRGIKAAGAQLVRLAPADDLEPVEGGKATVKDHYITVLPGRR